MYLSRLILTNFRNYSNIQWEPQSANNIVYGNNSQGKTNLLEAIHLLSTTRSFRTNHDKELINWAAATEPIPICRIAGEVIRGQQKLTLELALMGRKADAGVEKKSQPAEGAELTGIVQKKIRLNGIPRTAAEFTGQVNTVLFSSQDIEVIGGSPSLRRRYLDDMKSQVDRQYLRTLAHYNRVLEQRNHLLRFIQEEKARPDQLEFWNKELIEKGAYLIKQRCGLIEEIKALAHPLHLGLTAAGEDLSLKYLPNLKEISCTGDEVAIRQAFATKLKQYQPREIGAGVSLVGPHRDDLTFFINRVDLGTYGSRGQQRTLAISLKLAEARYLEKISGEAPIVLLDDILSELDAQRRGFIMQALPAFGQVISTTTDLDRFEPSFVADAKVFRIENGAIYPL